MIPETARAWVDVDLDALVHNARAFASRTNVPLLPMVKADGYGLGAVAIARALDAVDPWGFGVATIGEAQEIVASGLTRPVIVFTPLIPDLVQTVAGVPARPSLGDVVTLKAWLNHTTAPFHIEIDSGFGRSGFRWDDAGALAGLRDVLHNTTSWEGVYTHFHSADRDEVATAEQWRRFQAAVQALGRRPRLVHAAASGGGAYGAAFAGDLARPGIQLYGGRVKGLTSAPVAALRARVVATRRVAVGDTVGYDATWTAKQSTTIATLGIGYADGVHRSLSNRGVAELAGVRVPIAGRVSMDHTTLDVGDLPVALGDVATLFGGLVSVDEQAALAGTISYELLTSLHPRLPRRYFRGTQRNIPA